MRIPDFVLNALKEQLKELKFSAEESSGQPRAKYLEEHNKLKAYLDRVHGVVAAPVPTTHHVKLHKTFYDVPEKTFEIRDNDRNYKVGDILVQEEWDHERSEYTGRSKSFKITYILFDSSYGMKTGYVILAIIPIDE